LSKSKINTNTIVLGSGNTIKQHYNIRIFHYCVDVMANQYMLYFSTLSLYMGWMELFRGYFTRTAHR